MSLTTCDLTYYWSKGDSKVYKRWMYITYNNKGDVVNAYFRSVYNPLLDFSFLQAEYRLKKTVAILPNIYLK